MAVLVVADPGLDLALVAAGRDRAALARLDDRALGGLPVRSSSPGSCSRPWSRRCWASCSTAWRAPEARHYPEAAGGRGPAGPEDPGGLRLGVAAVALNLLALPLYLVPGLNIPVYLLLNGYLLGREYVEMVRPAALAAE